VREGQLRDPPGAVELLEARLITPADEQRSFAGERPVLDDVPGDDQGSAPTGLVT
jgi:hypothetical protein